MAVIQNLKRLEFKLRERAAKARKESTAAVVVGYTAAYAVYVHEDLTANHPVGQAKFLEEPARQLQKVFSKMILQALRRKATMSQALLLCGLRLQRESQELVPVDTGALKGSAFTRLEDK